MKAVKNIHKILARSIIIYFSIIMPTTSLAKNINSAEFEIFGLQDEPLINAKKSLASCVPKKHVTPKKIRACYNNGVKLIQTAIQPYGYFAAKITKQGLTHKGYKWTGKFKAIKGHRIRINHITLKLIGPGKNRPALIKSITNFPIKVGDPFESPKYEDARDNLLQSANLDGWLKAKFTTKKVEINLDKKTVSIVLIINTGKRFYFGLAHFNKNPFDPKFLNRFFEFHQGQPFSSKKLLKLQNNLNNSGYFTSVIVTPQTDQARNNKVPIEINLKPTKAKKYSAGLGWGTFTGPRIGLGADFHRIGKKGQHLKFRSRLSSVLQRVSLNYFIPGKNPLTDKYVFGINFVKFKPTNGDSASKDLSITRILTLNEWQHTLSIHYLDERYQINDDPKESSRALYPDYTVAWVHADNLMDPSSAFSIIFGIRAASEDFFSFSNFVQSDIKVKQIFSPTKAMKVILKGSFGYTVVNDLKTLPLTLRYNTGGINSIRGYEYSNIGPGRYLETAGIELQHKIHNNISGAVFYDIGTASDHLNSDLKKSTGVGIIYHSIVGPIRIYVAFPINDPGQSYGVEFSIGPEF